MYTVIPKEFSKINQWPIAELSGKLSNPNTSFRRKLFSELEKLSSDQIQSQATLIHKIIRVLPSDLTKENLPFFISIFTKIRSQSSILDQLNSFLMQSIRYGKIDLVTVLVDQGARISDQVYFEFTPLYEAISHSQEEIALHLIFKGADLTLRDERGNSYLHLACTHNCKKVVKRLAQKCNIERENKRGNSPLQMILIHKHRELFFKLIDLGATIKDKDLLLLETMWNIEFKKEKNESPSLIVLSGESWLSFNECLKVSKGRSLKEIIAEHYYSEGDFKQLQEVAGPSFSLVSICSRKEFINYCSENKALHLLKELVKLDLCFLDNLVQNPAIYNGVMELLLEEGDINHYIIMSDKSPASKRADRIQPLFQQAIEEGNIDQLFEILKATEQYDAQLLALPEDKIFSFLDHAVDQKAFALINRILNGAAKLNIDFLSHYYSHTPYHIPAILKELEGYPDKFLVDLYSLAARKKDLRICNLILDKLKDINTVGSTTKTALYHAVESFDLDLFDDVIDKSPNVNIKERRSGNSALHIAFAAGNYSIALDLLAAQGDYTMLNRHLESPLSLAIANNKLTFLISLIQSDCINPNSIINQEGDSLLHFALKNQHYQMIDLLLKKGANVNARNSTNQTPVQLLFGASFQQSEFDKIMEQFALLGADFNIESNGTLLCEDLIRKVDFSRLVPLVKSGYSLLSMSRVGVPLMELAVHFLSMQQMTQIAREIKDPIENGIASLLVAYRGHDHFQVAYLIDLWASREEGALFIKRLAAIKYLARHIAFTHKSKLVYLNSQSGYFDELPFFQKLDFLPMLAPSDIFSTVCTIHPGTAYRRFHLLYMNPIAVPGNERGLFFSIAHAFKILGDKLNMVGPNKPELGSFEETIVTEAQQFLSTLSNDLLALSALNHFTRFHVVKFIPYMNTWQRRLVVPFLSVHQFHLLVAEDRADIDQKIEIIESATREQLIYAKALLAPNLKEIEDRMSALETQLSDLEKNKMSSRFTADLESFRKQFSDFNYEQKMNEIRKEIACISKAFSRYQIQYDQKNDREAFTLFAVEMSVRRKELIAHFKRVDLDDDEEYTCPLLAIIMSDPVRDPTCGTLVDRSYFSNPNFDGLSPFTRKPIDVASLKTDLEFKAKIEAYLSSK